MFILLLRSCLLGFFVERKRLIFKCGRSTYVRCLLRQIMHAFLIFCDCSKLCQPRMQQYEDKTNCLIFQLLSYMPSNKVIAANPY